MTGRELLKKLENALNPDAEVFVNTCRGELKIFDVITHYENEITIECVSAYTNSEDVK